MEHRKITNIDVEDVIEKNIKKCRKFRKKISICKYLAFW